MIEIRDQQILDTDPDAIVLKTINAYVEGHAEKDDVKAAIGLAAVRPIRDWRTETLFRYVAVQGWAHNDEAVEALLSRVLSQMQTAPTSERVQ